ncbi:MAG TPA: glycosyltransferase family 2 protein [Kaistia sp.]|nr:glycosyltransferase family 2 protein [Kaistia sp.]
MAELPIAVEEGVPELTVVVPTFNESGNVATLSARLAVALAGRRWEAIFVDDDSPDGTAEAVRAVGARDPRIRCIRRVGRRGLAGACIEGMLAAQAAVVAVIDADLQHDESVLPAMLEAIEGGADIVVATRYAGGGEASSFSAVRGAMSRGATLATRLLLKVPSSDPMSGFFMLRRSVVEAVAPKLSTQGFKILLDILASVPPGLKVAEVSYSFGVRQSGASKLDNRVMIDFLGLLLSKATGGAISMRFVSFAAVGGLGLIVHLVALRLGLVAGVGFTQAQTVATVVAMTFNFFLNNVLTYRDRRLTGWRLIPGLLTFYVVCGLGAFANIGVGSWVFIETSRWWVAGLAGSVLGAMWNYLSSTALVWKSRP